MKPITLSEVQRQLLRTQVIDDLHPGSVLHDFQVVLDRIAAAGVEAAGKYNLLPMSLIPELDARLHRPLRLELKMKRPQLRSHPYLWGLHLLLRASGLTRIEGVGSKARLVVDPAAVESWNSLNPTERYFTLLEAWLLFGKAEMIGESGSRGQPLLMDCLNLWSYLRIVAQERNADRVQKAYAGLFGPKIFHAALLDLFGMLEVKYPEKPVQPWCPARVQPLPFGDAVLTLLESIRYSILGFEEEQDEGGEEEQFGFAAWQPLFQPYFPGWKNNLILPPQEQRAGVFVFRVSLRKVWRRIAISSESSLDVLVGCVLDSFGFDNDHLYQFTYRDEFGATITIADPRCGEGPFTDEELIGELPLTPGQSMALLYDFGDSWRFDVKLESIEPPGAKRKLPKVLEEHGEAPEQYPDSGW